MRRTGSSLRVALFVHCYFPEHFFGTESYTRTVARELLHQGHQPFIVTARFPGEASQDRLVEQYSIDGIPVFRIDRNFHPNRSVRDTFSLPDIRFIHERILRKQMPDIVHVCHLLNHTSAVLDVTAALDLPTVATFTDFFGFCYNNKLMAADGALCAGPNAARSNCVECVLSEDALFANGGPLQRLGARRLVAAALARQPGMARGRRETVAAVRERPAHLAMAYRRYAAALAPSRFLLDAYKRNGFGGPIELSHFGVDIDRSPKSAFEGTTIRLGFIGQLAPHKGPHLLLDALRRLAPSSFKLAIWGDPAQNPSYAAQLRASAEGLPVAFNGTFSPSDLAVVLATVDLLVIPSTWYENSPLILLQALATHTPVIVSDVEGMTEFIIEGRSGFRFRRDDPADLARVLAPFAQNPELAVRMSLQTAYERTSRAMVADVVELYNGVL